jgi:hypothetical protein
MLKKVLRVTVKNRLGTLYGSPDVNIKQNEERAATHTIAPGEDAQLPDGKELVPIESIELDTGALMHQTAVSVQAGVPITIDSTGDYRVAVTRTAGQNKWKLEFSTSQVAQIAAAKDTSGGGDPDKVNVTLGGDEPPAPPPAMAPIFLTGAGTFVAGWLISCCVSSFNTTLWYAVPIVVAAAGVVGAILARKKSN